MNIGKYSPTFTGPETKNCFSIIFRGDYQELQNKRNSFVVFVLARGDVFLYGGVLTVEVFSHTIMDKPYSSPDVVLIAFGTCDLVNGVFRKHNLVLEIVQFFLVNVRSVLWEREAV